MTTKIFTLCEDCRISLLDRKFRVKPVPTMAMTTDKADHCEWCSQSFPDEELKQYMVTMK